MNRLLTFLGRLFPNLAKAEPVLLVKWTNGRPVAPR